MPTFSFNLIRQRQPQPQEWAETWVHGFTRLDFVLEFHKEYLNLIRKSHPPKIESGLYVVRANRITVGFHEASSSRLGRCRKRGSGFSGPSWKYDKIIPPGEKISREETWLTSWTIEMFCRTISRSPIRPQPARLESTQGKEHPGKRVQRGQRACEGWRDYQGQRAREGRRDYQGSKLGRHHPESAQH